MNKTTEKIKPWEWIPSLYFAQGIPYVIVTSVAVILFNRLGISNTEIALYTGWLNLPWVIKPLWSPIVDILKSKRWWIVSMQLLIGGCLAGIAFLLPAPHAFRNCLAIMWLLAFSSATHDIAADGFYMLALKKKEQAYFVGIRNTFYRFAIIAGQGGLVMLAGKLEQVYGKNLPVTDAVPQAWKIAFSIFTIVFGLLFCYHYFFLPTPANDRNPQAGSATSLKKVFREFLDTFADFFRKKHILSALAFILLYRFAEAQLVKITSPFLLDPVAKGGLALSTTLVGFIYGTVGIIALTLGGITGGVAMARNGLKHWLWWMTAAMNLPNIVYLLLAVFRPSDITLISACVAVEQFGYGFGFTSLTYFMMLFSNGKHQTAHYAICTGFMALGMMLPGMLSGWVADHIGYDWFFAWIMICTVPSFIATRFVHIEE